MAAPICTDDFATVLRKSRLVSEEAIAEALAAAPEGDPATLAQALQTAGVLTPFQAGQLLRGRHKGFVLGKYKLLDRIGLGGMGQVYLAEHSVMRRRVALKVLPPDRTDNPFAKERFLREARAAAALDHPNLVRVYDIENDGDVHFLVMDHIAGVNLHELVTRRGPVAPERAANYLYQCAAGLSAVHARSLVHRDVKPANFVLDREGVVRLLDLGLVRSELDDDELTRQEGAKLIGTADYLAPEQALNCSKVDARADLYGLGATAYYLLTGQPPFKAEKISQKLLAHMVQEVKPVQHVRPGVPIELAAVVHKLLAKKPDDRYATAGDVMAALEPWAMVPQPPPAADDFPTRHGYTAPASAALSFAGRVPSLALGLPPQSKPIMKGVSGGSVVRIGASPSATVGNQPTAAVASSETAVNNPRPKPKSRVVSDSDTAAALFGVSVGKSAAVAGSNWALVGGALVAVALAAGGLVAMLMR